MTRRILFPMLFACSSLLVTAIRAGDQVFTVTGVVRGHLDDGKLIVQHDAIPGYMAAMTMAFATTDAKAAARLQPGDHIRFRFRVTETSSAADDFVVTRHETLIVEQTAPVAKGTRVREGDPVPPVSLVDENGQDFSNANFQNHVTVVTFIFSRCPVPEYCPAMALRFSQLQRTILADPKLTARARLLSITLDPEFDRPEILKAYGQAVGANPAIWQFITGAKSEVAALTKAFAVYTERNGVTLDHALCTAVIDRGGRVIAIWRGNGWKAEEVINVLTQKSTD